MSRRKSILPRTRRESVRNFNGKSRLKEIPDTENPVLNENLLYLEKLEQLKIRKESFVREKTPSEPVGTQSIHFCRQKSDISYGLALKDFQVLKPLPVQQNQSPEILFSSFNKTKYEKATQKVLKLKTIFRNNLEVDEILFPRQRDYSEDDKSYKALDNWKKNMLQRRQLENSLSKRLERTPESLLMHFKNDENLRARNTDKMMDILFPYVRHGGGESIKRSFWSEQEPTKKGLHIQREAFEVEDLSKIQSIGYSNKIKQEMSYIPGDVSDPPMKLKLTDECRKLARIMHYHPIDYSNLFVGPYSEKIVSKQNSQFLDQDLVDFNGQPINSEMSGTVGFDYQFNGPRLQVNDEQIFDREQIAALVQGILYHIAFPICWIDEKDHLNIKLTNLGSTKIKYTWQKIDINKKFTEETNDKVFFFNSKSDGLLPGQSRTIPVTFKSHDSAGSFNELWALYCRPMLYPTKIIFHFNGNCFLPDYNKDKRDKIIEEFETISSKKYIDDLIESLLDYVTKREKPAAVSSIEFKESEAEIYQRLNHGYTYKYNEIKDLQNWSYEVLAEDWDFSLKHLKQRLVINCWEKPNRDNNEEDNENDEEEDSDVKCERRLRQINEMCNEIDMPNILIPDFDNNLLHNFNDKDIICCSYIYNMVDQAAQIMVDISHQMDLDKYMHPFVEEDVSAPVIIVVDSTPSNKKIKKGKKSVESKQNEMKFERKLSTVEIRQRKSMFYEKSYQKVRIIVEKIFKELDLIF